ncbi:phosphopantothenoylcysteine decarboxylase [Dehalococcoides mccartyi]|uniref:bifunctional phosphopantothenoylcysteine decarboxylase/phosphopantothenate--cysteine ligase CoaBC n=1 Tax=Dehalococcoides mccartyi TaxID=61435 RepID=UPI0002B75E99|nr:bifunctional phosphopantothenoylcysteine decarboxylase/phosphopantothenate--cysteine ligase CoaBC [Dehalococcoides mccartyi]AGG07501.1 phosphopantothenoylcysteine decarboxylase/ Phosphopantothenoylcysteine synthetase [Dehalococcoides mccartyi BTF08]KSV16704.1 phosphopantothenoylcysteine decarboxylase [Dehalococcoides mccartyi]
MNKEQTVVLGITGSISAYKAGDIASKLLAEGYTVKAVMTEDACRFISPLTIRTLSHQPVVTSMWDINSEYSVEHVSLAEEADVILVAPATANIIAKLACGLANDMLSATILACKSPVIIAPAMNDNMYSNPITQQNISKLKEWGFIFVEPEYGRLASGKTGQGRLASLDKILGSVTQVLAKSGPLAGKKLVISAGGTREPVDPVRYVGNRSSGKMGYALAEEAVRRGASVRLVSGVTDRTVSFGVDIKYTETALEMFAALREAVKGADALIMTAAVADYRPEKPAVDKIKKGAEGLDLHLVANPDILASLQGDFIKVGFAAESRDLMINAVKKMTDKNLDIIAANDISQPDSTFGSDTTRLTLFFKNGRVEELPLLKKQEAAARLLDEISGLL